MRVDTVQRVTWGPEGYASFGQRLGAILLDSLIITGAGLVLLGLLGAVVAITDGNAVAVALLVLGVLVWIVGAYAYEAILVNRRGATIGKKVAGIEVRAADGGLPSAGQSWGRVLARGFLSGIFFLGYLWMLWDERNRTWHDMICGTYVVDRRRVSAATGAAGGPIAGYGPAYQTWGAPPQAWGGQPQAQPQPAWGAHPQPAWGSQPQPQPQPPAGVAPWAAPVPQPAPGDLPGLEDSPASGSRRPAAAPAETAGSTADERQQAEEPTGAQEPAPSEPPGAQQPTVVGEWAAEAAQATGASASEPAQATGASASEEAPAADQLSPATAAPGPPAGSDPNVVAVDQAGLAPESVSWLHQVAAQVDPRLDRVNPGWRGSSQAEAARACVFGLLLGRLAVVYPHMRADLSRAAEAHPSFSTLPAGNRLPTLERLAADPSQAARWLGPLVDVHDPGRIRALLE